MENLGVFPFGQQILPIVQKDRTKKRVFVLGVYASAVHARWVGKDGRQKIGAIAIASEPEIFWRGSRDVAQKIISAIRLPSAGHLAAANDQLNGPSGKALDELFLMPLGLSRDDAWLCDLVPHSCKNEKQVIALQREYDPVRESLGLPNYDWPSLPRKLTDPVRRMEIERELLDSGADTVVTLGDQPLKWFTSFYGTSAELSAYGKSPNEYGQLHSMTVAGRKFNLIPLVHPRQAARLGSHSADWADLHDAWVTSPPKM